MLLCASHNKKSYIYIYRKWEICFFFTEYIKIINNNYRKSYKYRKTKKRKTLQKKVEQSRNGKKKFQTDKKRRQCEKQRNFFSIQNTTKRLLWQNVWRTRNYDYKKKQYDEEHKTQGFGTPVQNIRNSKNRCWHTTFTNKEPFANTEKQVEKNIKKQCKHCVYEETSETFRKGPNNVVKIKIEIWQHNFPPTNVWRVVPLDTANWKFLRAAQG